jgi:BirA family transcriptional regulator, biotin operon repressor / biotin---[acetyl-CoA-carboxylase] ligase
MTSQPFDLDRIRASGLVGEVEFHAEIGSTNDRSAELAGRAELACPVLVLAAHQTGGRGRGANRWWSAPGALTFSLVLDSQQVNLPTERWPQIALAAGAAVCDAIEEAIPQAAVRVKWPNDVYLAGKKTCGILVEAPADGRGRLIVGIGVNVNNSLAGAPDDLRRIATSMTDEAGRTFVATDVLLSVLSHFAEWRSDLARDERAVFARWRTRCLLTGKRVCLNAGSRQVTGLCRGIDDTGRLVLSTSDGTSSYLSGTVVSFE